MLALGLAAFVGVCSLIWAVTREQQIKVVKYMEQKSAGETLRRQITNLFMDANLCSCQVAGPTHTFDSGVTDGSQKISFSELRNACGAAAPIVLQVGGVFPGGMKVAKIELANLQPSAPASPAWTADWVITWDTGSGTPIKATEIPQRVILNTTTPPASAQLAGCAPPPGGSLIQYCPTGWTMIGSAGAIGTYCIETNEHGAAANYTAAGAACANPAPTSLGFGHLCNHSEWYTACRTIPGFAGTVTGWEWNVEYAGNDYEVVASGGAGGGNCNASSKQNITSATLKFRCCFP